MLRILICLIIVLAQWPAESASAFQGAADAAPQLNTELQQAKVLLDDRDRLFYCDFGPEMDVNYDKWPDHGLLHNELTPGIWQKQKGFGFPKYTTTEITADQASSNGFVMGMELDGQKAAMYSPPIPVGQQFSYVLNVKCRIQIRDGHNCRAWASINFLDADEKLIVSHKTPVLLQREGWFQLSTELLALDHPSIAYAKVGLHIDPLEETSLFGKCWFDDVALFQLPRIVIQTGRELNVFTDPSKIELHCQVSGARRKDAGLQMELYDERGTLLRSTEKSLLPGNTPKKMVMLEDGTFQSFAVKHLVWKLIEDGKPRPPDEELRGYYRLVIKLLDRDTRQMVRELSFVVVEPIEAPQETMFGWSLEKSIYDLEQNTLVSALRQLGVNWIKMPVWIDVENYTLLEKIGTLLQKLNRYSIDVVGVFDDPPEKIYKRYWQHEHGMAALTADVELFQAAIEPVMTQLSLRIGRWQLGSDDDTSIAEDLIHIDKMKSMKSFFVKYGEESKVGLPWTWMLQRIPTSEQSWDFTSSLAYPELSASELSEYLVDTTPVSAKDHYISLQPLPASQYDLQTRLRDYAQRFIEIKRLGVKRVFVPRPFDADSGFFRANDMPTEMLCAWRTLAAELNGARYMGSFQMPGFSENHLFEKDGYALMLAWNDAGAEEQLFLGEDLEVVDLFGRNIPVVTEDGGQTLHLDGWPVLVKNMNLAVAKIRQSVAFDRESLESRPGQRQPLKLAFDNGFGRGISGAITLVNDTLFSPQYTLSFKAGRGDTFEYTIPMMIHQDALTGEQLVRLDYKFHNEELQPFSAWHPLRIGLPDVEFAIRTKKTEDNQFLVKMTLINRSDQPVSYVAYLFVPGRKRMSVMFHNVKPGQQSKILRVYNAQELLDIGQPLWMSARQTRGSGNLNYQIDVAENPTQ